METIYLAGGCFWGCQKFFDQFDGVLETETGYANGPEGTVTYEEVCRDSGHAETVKIVYDETVISLRELLTRYFTVIDPLSVNRQGHDTGIQYRTGIYYVSRDQLPVIRQVFGEEEKKAGAKLAVEVEPLRNFCAAEEYHQKYLDKNPGGYCHIPAALFTWKEKQGQRKITRGNREERIAGYEKMLDRAEEALRQMDRAQQADEARSVYNAVRDDLEKLEKYYTSREWKEDFEADEAGLLLPGLKRGVLSEDGIDSVLERFREYRDSLGAEGTDGQQPG